MRTFFAVLVAFVLTSAASTATAQSAPDDRRDLRTRIEARYDVVPLSDGIALRPRSRMRGVRLIEVSDGGILIDGDPVTGRELRERVGSDADLIVRLSYLDDAARRDLFGSPGGAARAPETDRPAPAIPEPAPLPGAPEAPDVPEAPEPAEGPARARTSHGDRVRILGGVNVERDERIHGQAVAVLGSVRIDGEVTDQVVAVLGSVNLGPEAVVGGDIVAVGGHVNRASGAVVRGGVTEVAVGRGSNVELPGVAWAPFGFFFGPFGGVARLIGSTFHFLVLALLACIALLVARVTVERSADRVAQEPLKATLVGIVSQILIIPVFVLVAIVLAITVIGIPLLLLLPFAALFLLLLALAGFAGTALTVGRAVGRRFGSGDSSAVFGALVIGVLVIMLPLLLGRVIGLVGWPASPLSYLLLAAGLGLEYLAWASGFGAVLINAFTRWQARRSSPPAPESATV